MATQRALLGNMVVDTIGAGALHRRMETKTIKMTEKQLTTTAVSVGTCILMALEQILPEHSRKARAMRKVQDAIVDLAALHAEDITEEETAIAREAWNAAMAVITKHTEPQSALHTDIV